MEAGLNEQQRFARARNPDSTTVEVRVDMRKDTVLWLDAISMAEDRSRGALINEVLGEWAAKQAHVHSVVNRVVGSNPNPVESEGAAA